MADLTVRKLDGALGAEIAGLDLAQPVDAADFAAIEDALDEHLVVLFRGQDLDAAALAAFGRRFGAARPHALKSYRHPDHDDVSYIRNVDDDGKIDPFGNIRATTWHADATYEDVLPRLAILHAREIPSTGGGTFFANMCAAHDALPDTRKRELESLTGLHGYATGPAGRYYQGQNDHSGEFPERRRPGVVRRAPDGPFSTSTRCMCTASRVWRNRTRSPSSKRWPRTRPRTASSITTSGKWATC